MTYNDILIALEKGTVIFNAAGAHIPKLAQPSLCCTDATSLPCALNLYITSSQQRTSAPPHTDKQGKNNNNNVFFCCVCLLGNFRYYTFSFNLISSRLLKNMILFSNLQN